MRNTISIFGGNGPILAAGPVMLALLAPAPVAGGNPNPVVEVAGMQFDTERAMRENLQAHLGKTLTLYLDSGAEITGRVKGVGQQLVHLEQIARREFMDALLRIDSIVAIEGRFRAYQRDLERLGLQPKADSMAGEDAERAAD